MKTTCRRHRRALHSLIDNRGMTREFSIASWGTVRHVLAHDLVCLNTWFFLDYLRPTRGPGMEHVEPKHDSPQYGRRERLYMHCEGSLKARSVGMREVSTTGLGPATDYYRGISMTEERIIWHAINLKVTNHSQKMRNQLEHGEQQGIMAGSGRVKDGGYKRFFVGGLVHIQAPLLLANFIFCLSERLHHAKVMEGTIQSVRL